MNRKNRPTRKNANVKPVGEKPEVAADVEVAPTDEKLQKVLARLGIGSRREMEKAIVEGRVKVNGLPAKLGDRVKSKEKIEFDGRVVSGTLSKEQRLRVILYNKPEGEICSRSDPEGRPTVYSNLPRLPVGRWISVGRLDFNTTGLMLFTTDGDLANKLMHPSSAIDREYLVRIQGQVDDDMVKNLREGVLLEDGIAKFTDIQEAPTEGGNQWFYCVVMEGRNREVRRLWESQGVRVSRLKRVRYGNVFIPSYVRMGQWVELTDREIKELCVTAGVDAPPTQKFSEGALNTRERHLRRLRSPGASASKPKKQERSMDLPSGAVKTKRLAPNNPKKAPWEPSASRRKPTKRR